MRNKSLLAALAMATTVFVMAVKETPAQTIPNNVTFRNYFGTMVFNKPLLFAQYPGEDSAHIVLLQVGRIITVRRQGGNWVKTDSALITVNGGTSAGNEQGLLGFAFHPSYNVNRKYYVYYIGGSGNGINVLAERTADSTLRPKTADVQRTVLRISDYASNHNGGTIGFGPDGKLYVGLGDGGNSNDASNLAQNLDTLFGKILRIDVDGTDAYPSDSLRNYAIPSDNPYFGQGRRGEIWARGLRNPWKWSFHPLTQELWVGDVGQNTYEEVSRVTKGGNMGWRLREAAFCFNPTTNCSTPADSLVAPAITIARGHGQSVTGGVFYSGNPTAAYHGVYIFGDYASDRVWAMRRSGGTLTDSTVIGQVFNVSSFDRDSRGRVFASSISSTSTIASNNGIVYILESPDMVSLPVSLRHGTRTGAGFKLLRLSEVRRNPDAYEVRALDGRALPGTFSGTAWIRKKGSTEPARLFAVP